MERNEIPSYVPDASIVVKWFVREEDSSRSRKLKEQHEQGAIDLDAPSLLSYEVASALRFHPVARFAQKHFSTVMESLEALQITREPTHKEWTIAYELSLENSISIYDAIYLGFAVSRNSKVVTADVSLLQRLRSAEIKQNVTMLTDLNL